MARGEDAVTWVVPRSCRVHAAGASDETALDEASVSAALAAAAVASSSSRFFLELPEGATPLRSFFCGQQNQSEGVNHSSTGARSSESRQNYGITHGIGSREIDKHGGRVFRSRTPSLTFPRRARSRFRRTRGCRRRRFRSRLWLCRRCRRRYIERGSERRGWPQREGDAVIRRMLILRRGGRCGWGSIQIRMQGLVGTRRSMRPGRRRARSNRGAASNGRWSESGLLRR